MRKLVIAAVSTGIFMCLAGTVDAQGQPKPEIAASTTMEQMLAELRALRVEMNQAASAGLRAQLLVARLALQEQRINAVGREVAEIEEKLQASEQYKPVANLMKSLDHAEADEPGGRDEPNPFLDLIRNQADRLDKAGQQLRNRHAELSRILADEQSRWTAFNAQLEALEHALGGK